MALEIRATPILTGKDAERIQRIMRENEKNPRPRNEERKRWVEVILKKAGMQTNYG